MKRFNMIKFVSYLSGTTALSTSEAWDDEDDDCKHMKQIVTKKNKKPNTMCHKIKNYRIIKSVTPSGLESLRYLIKLRIFSEVGFFSSGRLF